MWDPPDPARRIGAVDGGRSPAVSTADAVVELRGVTKSFGQVVAVSDVSTSVGPGVTALLGPNGAGKSTLLRLICGLTPPTVGTVRVFGADVRRDRDVRGRLGLAPQQDALFGSMTVSDFVELAARTHGLADPVRSARSALERVELGPLSTTSVRRCSKGVRQRVKLAAALVNDPELVVLDEPLTGLDPVQRARAIDLFHRLGDAGACLVVASHVLDEVARLGSDVMIVAQGRLIARGDYRVLRDLLDDRPRRIRVVADDPRRLAAALVSAGIVDAVSLASDSMLVDTSDIDRFGRSVAVIARDLAVRLYEVEPADGDLESVFRYLVERR